MKVKCIELPLSDKRDIEQSFVNLAGRNSTSVSSVNWTVEEGSSVTISGVPSLSSNISTASILADSTLTGCSMLKIQATLADGQKISEYLQVDVIEPSC